MTDGGEHSNNATNNDEATRLAGIIANALSQLSNHNNHNPYGTQYQHTQGENSNAFLFKQFNDARPKPFNGTEGGTGILQWIESIEDTLDNINYPEDQKVKMAASAFQHGALTWWNA